MHTKTTLRAAALALMMSLAWPTRAADEHGESTVAEAGKAWPSVTAVSASFELVARLTHEQLTILVDRAASNEPVLNATLQLELDGRTLQIPFAAEHGGYVLSEREMLNALQHGGHKQLAFTLNTGALSETLRGELAVDSAQPPAAGTPPGATGRVGWLGLAAAVLLLLIALWRRFPDWRKAACGGAR